MVLFVLRSSVCSFPTQSSQHEFCRDEMSSLPFTFTSMMLKPCVPSRLVTELWCVGCVGGGHTHTYIVAHRHTGLEGSRFIHSGVYLGEGAFCVRR